VSGRGTARLEPAPAAPVVGPAPVELTAIVLDLAGGQEVRATVESVLAQDVSSIEVVVLRSTGDDRPSGPPLPLDPRCRTVRVEPRDPADAIAAAWPEAAGRWIVWLAPGVLLYPAAIARVLEFAGRRPEVDAWWGDANLLGAAGETVAAWAQGGRLENGMPRLEHLRAPLLFLRRGAVGERAPLRAGDDPGIPVLPWIRLALGGARFAHLPALLSVRPHAPSAHETSGGLLREMIRLLATAGHPVPPAWRLAEARARAHERGIWPGHPRYRRTVLDLAVAGAAPAVPPVTGAARIGIALAGLRTEIEALASGHPLPFPRPLAPLVSRAIAAARAGLGTKLFRFHTEPPRSLAPPAGGPPPLPPDPPRISIVTPSLDHGRFLERTIRSVVEQDYPALEYVVRDGGSRDGTVEILERWAPCLASWESAPDDGQAEAINRGFSRSTGDVLGWLNSDDLLLPGSLATVAAYFAARPEIDVVYGHRLLIDAEDRVIGRWVLPRHDDRLLAWVDYVPQETLFWRRRIWERVGSALDPTFHFALDWDLLLRFREAGARFARIPRFLGAFRVTAEQKSSRDLLTTGRLEMDRLRLRALGTLPTDGEIRRVLRPYLARHWVLDRWLALRARFAQ
jgi:GT2 family glycosyltransferase